MPFRRCFAVALGFSVLLGGLAGPTDARAEAIKVGVLRTTGGATAFYLAKEKGYFAAEQLEAEPVFFDAAQPTAVATVSGDIDFAVAGMSAALYTLAGGGQIRLIAGSTYDRAGFTATGLVVSNQAHAAGLTSVRNLSGHSVALTQVGSTYHYILSVVAAKYGVDFKTVQSLPLQSMANITSAVTGGRADTGILLAPITTKLVESGRAKLLAWVGEEVPWQVGVAWTSGKIANGRHDLVERFLRAYRRGVRDYDEAFAGPGGVRRNGPTAAATLAALAKFLGQPAEEVDRSISYVDPEARIDFKDIARQIAWYRSQGMVQGDFGIDQVVDRRYAVAMPEQ